MNAIMEYLINLNLVAILHTLSVFLKTRQRRKGNEWNLRYGIRRTIIFIEMYTHTNKSILSLCRTKFKFCDNCFSKTINLEE